jgi:hypothetical protein
MSTVDGTIVGTATLGMVRDTIGAATVGARGMAGVAHTAGMVGTAIMAGTAGTALMAGMEVVAITRGTTVTLDTLKTTRVMAAVMGAGTAATSSGRERRTSLPVSEDSKLEERHPLRPLPPHPS